MIRLVQETQPTEFYSLAAQSHPAVGFETPEYTADVDEVDALGFLEALRIVKPTDTVKFYQASRLELYGLVQEVPQRETTPLYPRTPYAASKFFAHWITVNYRKAYGIRASNGIFFNHEGPLRGETLVTRAVAAIEPGRLKTLYLDNIDAKRDWGHAGDYIEGMYRIVPRFEVGDYVLAGFEMPSVCEFVELAFAPIYRVTEWNGEGLNEVGIDQKSGKILVCTDPRCFRPTGGVLLLGDPAEAKEKFGRVHTTSSFNLVKEMVAEDIRTVASEAGRIDISR